MTDDAKMTAELREGEAWKLRAENLERALSQLARAVRRVIDAKEMWRSPDRPSHPNLVLEEAEAWIGLTACFDLNMDVAALAHPQPEPARSVDLEDDRLAEGDGPVEPYVNAYEYRSGEGDYVPTRFEREIISDAIHGFITMHGGLGHPDTPEAVDGAELDAIVEAVHRGRFPPDRPPTPMDYTDREYATRIAKSVIAEVRAARARPVALDSALAEERRQERVYKLIQEVDHFLHDVTEVDTLKQRAIDLHSRIHEEAYQLVTRPVADAGLRDHLELAALGDRAAPIGSDNWTVGVSSTAERLLAALAVPQDQQPIPMVLHCPRCCAQHIDVATATWANPAHCSHLCEACGHIWRPADLATVGVTRTQTHGKDDTPSATNPEPSAAEVREAALVEAIRWALGEDVQGVEFPGRGGRMSQFGWRTELRRRLVAALASSPAARSDTTDAEGGKL